MLYISVESSDEEEPDNDSTVILEIDSPTTASSPHCLPKPKTGRRTISRLYWDHVRDRDEAPTIPIYDVCDYSEE